MWRRATEEGSGAAFGEIVEEAGDVVAVLANAFAQPLDFGRFVVDFAGSKEKVAVHGRDDLV